MIAVVRYKEMKSSKGKAFPLDHYWILLEHCEKWKLRDKEAPPKKDSFTKMENDDGTRNKNKLDGNKKAKDKIKREAEASSLRGKN